MRLPATATRRSVLSLAAVSGVLAVTAPPLPAFEIAPDGTGFAVNPDAEPSLRAVFPGAGIKRVYKDVFRSTTFQEMLLVSDPGGVPKLITTTTGSNNQFQVLDAATGKREYVSPPVEGGIAAYLLWDPGRRTVYAANDGELLAWTFQSRKLVSLGQAAPSASALYGFDLDASGRVWGGSFPDGIIWSYDPAAKRFASYPAIDERTDYVRAVGVWKDTVFAGTGSIDPRIVSFPTGAPRSRKIIELPDGGPSGFVFRILVRGDKVFVIAEDSTNTSHCYIYNPVKSRWEGELESASRAFSDGGGNITWHAARSLLIRRDTTTMSEQVLCPVNISLVRSILVSGDKIFAAGEHAGAPVVAEYSISKKKETRRVRPAVLSGSLAIQSLIGSDHGLLYLGGYQGDGLASLNPVTDARWRSSNTTGVAQIEHLMQYDRNRLYLGSYGSAKLFSFDRSRISEGDAAFTRITTLRDPYMQSRPFAWAAAGGKVLAGTVPEFGLRGGALAHIDPVANRLGKVIARIIPEQSVVGLAGYGDTAYGTTSARGGYGAADYLGDACVFAYNARTEKMLWVSYLKGTRDIYSPILLGGVLYVATVNGLLALDPATGKLRDTLSLRDRTGRPGYQSVRALRVPGTTKIIHSWGGIVSLIDVGARTRSVLQSTDAGTQLAVMPDGRVFVSYQSNHIAELSMSRSPLVLTFADLVTINASGDLMVARSNGGGGYGPAERRATGFNAGTILSFHVTDWNGDGIPDILVQRRSGVLEIRLGRADGGFDGPVTVATGWSAKRLAVGPWTSSMYPTVIGVSSAGEVRRHPVGASGAIGSGYVLGSGWKNRDITMIDLGGSGLQGLLGRSGARLYFQQSNGKGAFQGTQKLVASAGWSDAIALASVTAHFRDRSGLLSVKGSGALQYISAQGSGFAGIINYPLNLRTSFLAGSPKL